MHLTRHDHPAELLTLAEPLLNQTEAENTLLYGILLNLEADDAPHADDSSHDAPYLASLQDDTGTCLAVALQTPPFVMVMTPLAKAGQQLLLEDLQEMGRALSGVLGAEPSVNAFADAWAAATGHTARPNMRQRIYRLDRVQTPAVRGQFRGCTETDRTLVEAWTQGFVNGLGLHGGEHLIPKARDAFDRGRFFLWEHGGEPCSMAALVGETPRGARIGYVYTPPQRRRRGFGAACTAAVSQHYLDRGKEFCCLHADLANPVSNSIYQRIGYRAIGDVQEILFTE